MSQRKDPYFFLHGVLLPELILDFSVATCRSLASRTTAFALYTALIVRSLLVAYDEDKHQEYTLGSSIGARFFTAVVILLLSDSFAEYRHKKDTVEPSQLSLLRRTFWAFSLSNNPRGIGWNWEAPYLRPVPTNSRLGFIAWQMWRAVRFYAVLDVAEAYNNWNPLSSVSSSEVLRCTNALQGPVLRTLNIIGVFGVQYASMNLAHIVLAVVTVALGLYEPRDWPPLFGHWSDSYTVRRFWNRTWHQTIRRMAVRPGKVCAQLIGFASGSFGSKYAQLWVGFAVSGLIHVFGDFVVGREWIFFSLPFFLVQAAAIMVEDHIVDFLAKKKLHFVPVPIQRLVGYLWVFMWFHFSAPIYIDWMLPAGVRSPRVLRDTLSGRFFPPWPYGNEICAR